eukprot:COSAG02_NODE_14763_length_1238_cov_2.578578_2_plen_74_part_00
MDVSRDGLQALGSVLDAHHQPMHLEPELPLCPLELVQELLCWDLKLAVGDKELQPHTLVSVKRKQNTRAQARA